MDLLAFERKLDQTIARKRMEIQEAIKKPLTVCAALVTSRPSKLLCLSLAWFSSGPANVCNGLSRLFHTAGCSPFVEQKLSLMWRGSCF